MILTLNCGSSSLKYQLFSPDLAEVVAAGQVTRIGESGGSAVHRGRAGTTRLERDIPDHPAALALMMQCLTAPEGGALAGTAAIQAIGHRVVHGGTRFVESVLVNEAVLRQLRACIPFAPLHNPCNIAGIEAALRLFPDVANVAVFDTAFHQTLPPRAHIYALPYDFYARDGIRRYGFHGTSFRYVSAAAAAVLRRPLEDLALVVCHLGNGASIAAIDGGRSVDTSLGFGTFCGVAMGTRVGDLDPAILFHLVRAHGLSLDAVEVLCYRESGLLGLSGRSNDMREVLAAAAAGDARCRLAVDVFVYQIRKTIGAYAVAMNRLDALVFTAGIGEHSAEIRARVCADLDVLGIAIDATANAAPRPTDISAPGARVATLVVPTDEERMIAMDTLRLTHSAEAAAAE